MHERTRSLAQITVQGRLTGLLALAVIAAGCPPPPTEPEVDPVPVENRAPTASAGTDVTASIGIGVRLEGVGTDADGDFLTYRWTLDAPAGSAATLDDAATSTPEFTPDVPGDYAGTLFVHDGEEESAPDVVTVSAADNTTTATIGDAGGAIESVDGDFTFTLPPGSLDADAMVSLTPLARSQMAALGDELAARLAGMMTPVAFKIQIQDSSSSVSLSLPGTATWRTETDSDGDSTDVAVPEIMQSDGEDAQPVDEQQTQVDWDNQRIVHTGVLGGGALVAFIPDLLDVRVTGLPQEVSVGETFTATVIGSWRGGDGAAPEQAEVGSAEEGAVRRVDPSASPVRVAVIGDVFLAAFDYTCDAVGAGRVILLATTLEQQGDPSETGRFPTTIERTVACTPPSGGGDGLPLGLQPLPGLNDIEAVSVIDGPIGSIQNVTADAALFAGKEGFQLRGLGDNRVIVDGIQPGSANPLTRIMAVSRPNPGPGIPAVIFGSGLDFGNGINAQGGWRFDYDPGTQTFADTPAELPGAYWDAQPAGGIITEEIVGATNFGVDFIQWDGTTWSHDLDLRLPLARYGNERLVSIGTAVAAEANGPLLVPVGYHNGDPGRLFYDDRSDGDPVDVGPLGVSPAMIRCAIPICLVVFARDHEIQPILWNGVTQPTIVGDPVPVGLDPGAVAVFHPTEGLTVAATFTGYTDDHVTVTELDDDANVLRNGDMDLRAVGCRGARSGDWVPNTMEPGNPYLVIGCFDTNNYYITTHDAFFTN